MRDNLLWRAFLIVMALIVVGYTAQVMHVLYRYQLLDSNAPTASIQWSIKELSEEGFVLQPHYAFVVHGKTYSGDIALQDPVFRSAWAAENAMPEYAKRKWRVWYSSANMQFSSLQKKFPLKQCLSVIVLWGILFYFICLGYKMRGLLQK